MLFNHQKLFIASWLLVLALLGGTFGVVPVQPAQAAPQMIKKESSASTESIETALLVKDVNPGPSGAFIQTFEYLNGTLYFNANGALWKSDGTTDGTVRIVGGTITVGSAFTSANGMLYFSASDGTHGFELWKSDGTTDAAVMVKDIRPGANSAFDASTTLVNSNGVLYFKANDGSTGVELWKSDGTEAGTVLVKDIMPGTGWSNIADLIDVNGSLFFTAEDGSHGNELWKSDGTSTGTMMVKDVLPGTPSSSYYELTNVNGILFFTASGYYNNYELWKSNGTEAGTVLVRDIRPGEYPSYPDSFENVNGTLFFTADDGTHGNELWKSDGTSAGTVLVKDIWPGASGWGSVFTHVGDTLYFGANDGASYSLWKSNGTSAGTAKVGSPGPGDDLINFNGIVYYQGSEGAGGHGYELWKSDGTSTGTVLVKDINPSGDSYPDKFVDAGGTLFFTADDGVRGYELWKVGIEPIPEHPHPIHYVKQTASGTGDGTSWMDAHTDLQSALAAASSGDEIWVAAGTYKPTTGTDRTVSFALKNGVAVYGGFAGTETARTQRDFETNLTVLSGDVGATDDNIDNSYHVVIGSNTDNSAVLDGCTVTGGNANGLTIDSDSGGGMYNDTGSPSLTNVNFTGNSALNFGGGMYNVGEVFYEYEVGSNPILTNVTFSENTAVEGGGMRNTDGSNPILINVIFSDNTAEHTGGGMENFYRSSPTLTNVTFNRNSAVAGGGMMNWTSSSPILTNVTFDANSATEEGGGMFNGGFSTEEGGASNPVLTNVTFDGNSAINQGGGIYNENESSPNLINVTLRANQAAEGGGIYNFDGSNPSITNSILYNNPGGSIYDVSGTRVVTYSIVQGGYSGEGNIDTDPLLGSLGDYGGNMETIPLLFGSPAIDAGDDANCPSIDQRGVMRPQDGDRNGSAICDIGAYETEPDTTLPTVSSIVRADEDPTSAESVKFTVTFSEPVMGVETNDFTLDNATGGISGATINSVLADGTCAGSAYCAIYTVTVNTGEGNGTLRLDVPADASIEDAAGNSLAELPFEEGEFYTVVVYGVGKYDDADKGWTYSGFTATATTGPYKGTMHYSKVIGNTAEFTFEGSQIVLSYSKYSNRGNLEVYLDDNPDPIATINEYSATRVWQASWTSGNLGAGEHTIRLVHASGAQVDVDALEVKEYEVPGLGKYDDVHAGWTYSGFTATTTTGPYLGTMHYSKGIGNTAEFTFEGSQIVLTYSKYSNRGNLEVYLDDNPDPIATINEYNATRVWQASWTSGDLGAGEHTVRLVHASGAQVDIDALEVKEYEVPGMGKHDDAHAGWSYNGFVATTTTGPYLGTMHYSKVIGNTAEFTFDGSQITVTYSKYSNRGNLEVYLDDNPDPIATIDQYNGTRVWQATWTSGNLGAGEHTVRLVHASGAQVDIDTMEVKEYVNPGPGKYDDVQAGWTYNGFVATTTTGPYKGTMHYSKVVGSEAEFTFEGSQIVLTYSKYSNRGTLEVYIDDNPDPIAMIDQYNGTRIWQASWTSEDLGAGEHTVRLVHASGAQVDIDALTVQGP